MSEMPSVCFDVLVVGGGAAGLMCAIEAGKRGRRVLVLEKAKQAGRKILVSGGGRCNFTNLYSTPEAFLSNNPHFCKSALARYTQWDFIALMEKSDLSWHEKKLGQLFCREKANAVLKMLLSECAKYQVGIELDCAISSIAKNGDFLVNSNKGRYPAKSLVMATGGPSIPKMGSTDFSVRIAKQFGIANFPFKPALVPFVFPAKIFDHYFDDLAGVSLECVVSCHGQSFRENVLITHRGLSGPACLQISSYWQMGDAIEINLLPDIDATALLLERHRARSNETLKTVLGRHFPRRLAIRLADTFSDQPLSEKSLAQIKQAHLRVIGETLNRWVLKPSGTEGMRTAEVSLGGVDTGALSSKTMEVNAVKDLYFIGETVDVTGWLGGYNFQWAWASGWVAGQYV